MKLLHNRKQKFYSDLGCYLLPALVFFLFVCLSMMFTQMSRFCFFSSRFIIYWQSRYPICSSTVKTSWTFSPLYPMTQHIFPSKVLFLPTSLYTALCVVREGGDGGGEGSCANGQSSCNTWASPSLLRHKFLTLTVGGSILHSHGGTPLGITPVPQFSVWPQSPCFYQKETGP